MARSFKQTPPYDAASMTVGAALIAHQGGWDEALLIAGPVVLICVVLAIVKRRVAAHEGEYGEPHDDDV